MRARLRAVAVAGLLAAGCAGPGVSSHELPEAPIALIYFDPETARRFAEHVSRELESGAPPEDPASQRENRAIADTASVSNYLGKLLGQEEGEQKYPGRLSLYHPRTDELETLAGPRQNAVPMQWSRDRRRLLFSQVVRDHPKLFEYEVETGEMRRLTHGSKAHPEGCYGPEDRLVYTEVDVERLDQNARVMLSQPGGEGGRPISPPGVYASFPACAPDGSAVAWVVSLGTRQRIQTRAPVVDGEIRDLGPGRDPFFSPDGEWIVYSAPEGHRGWRLWRVRADGSGRARIGRGVLDELRPTVSPDGRLVAYVAEQSFRNHLYLRRFDGTGDRMLFGDGAVERPVW